MRAVRKEVELSANLDRLASDPNAIEHEAREELRYTRPGEVIYTLPGNDAGTAPDASSQQSGH